MICSINASSREHITKPIPVSEVVTPPINCAMETQMTFIFPLFSTRLI